MKQIDDFENYDDSEYVNEKIFAPLIEDGLTNLRLDENKIEFYECPSSFEDEFNLYYETKFKQIIHGRNLIYNTKNNFNETNIHEFKKWMYNYFAGHIMPNKSIELLFNWNEHFTRLYMDIALFYLEVLEDRFLNDCDDFKYFYELEKLISAIVIAPFEAELFEQIEDDWGIFEDED